MNNLLNNEPVKRAQEALKKFDKIAQENMSMMNFNAKTLYNNFKKIL